MDLAWRNPGEREDLLKVLQESERLMCQDPRDKVYAVLSMVDWGELQPTRPDYSEGRLSLSNSFESCQK